MGEQFTAADVVIGSTLRWGTMFKLLPERPEFSAYIERLRHGPRCNARKPGQGAGAA
jgi:glutathione S-transferase